MNPRRRRHQRIRRKRNRLHAEIDLLVGFLDEAREVAELVLARRGVYEFEAAEDIDANELVAVRADGKAVLA
jgi:hypothetical protein